MYLFYEIPSYKINKIPLFIGMFFNILGYFGLVICSIHLFTYEFMGKPSKWGLFWFSGNTFQMILLSLALLCIGYTNIDYVRGVSYKSQRNIVYLGYLLIISIILTIIYFSIFSDLPFWYVEP